jgi:hypothetical protein
MINRRPHECIFMDRAHLDVLLTAMIAHDSLMRFGRFFHGRSTIRQLDSRFVGRRKRQPAALFKSMKSTPSPLLFYPLRLVNESCNTRHDLLESNNLAFRPSANQPASLSICRVFEVKVTSVGCQDPFLTFESGSFEPITGVRDPLLRPERHFAPQNP